MLSNAWIFEGGTKACGITRAAMPQLLRRVNYWFIDKIFTWKTPNNNSKRGR